MSHLNGHGNGTSGLALAPLNAPPTDKSFEEAPYLLFESRGVLCGVQASAVREVLLLPEIAPLDGVPLWVGVLDVRGRMVPVVDPAELAGQAPRRFQTSDSVVVLEGAGGQSLGLIVESVRDVRSLSSSDIETAASGATPGLARVDGEIVRLLSLSHLLAFSSREAASGQAPARSFCPDASPGERALFASRAQALRAPSSQTAMDASAPTLVAVRLGGETFGLDLDWVREFATRLSPSPVPGGPPDLLGLVNRRGEVVPLLDLRLALGLSSQNSAGEHIAFVECEGASLGLAVEAVLGVFTPLEGELLPPPATAGASDENVRAAARFENQTLAVLDLRNLLQSGGWTARD